MSKTKVERISFWWVAGPFDNPKSGGKRTGLNIPYLPEESPVDIIAKYVGKGGKEVSWQELVPCPNGFIELGNLVPEPECVAYAFTCLFAEKAGEVELDFGPYAGIKVFVNGEVVGAVEPPDTAYEPRRGLAVFKAHLKSGKNELLVKCEHGPRWYGFFFRTALSHTTLHTYLRDLSRQLARSASKPPETPRGARRWQAQARRELTRLMSFPKEKVVPRIKVALREDCGSYIREKFYFASERNFEVPAMLLVPKRAKPDRKGKALLALHGHGHGLSDVTGTFDYPGMAKNAHDTGYDYAHRFAEAGYVVMTIDSRAFGELADISCGAAYPLANSLGRPLVGMRVWDAMRALDILEKRPEVDPNRIGCTGLSWGGTHTAYLSMLDQRVKAALVSGYFSDFEDILYREAGCPCQHLPGVAAKFDFQDLLFGLVAPRPLYIQNGVKDPLYTPEAVRKAFREGSRIYRVLGAPKNAVLEMHDGAHEYRFAPALEWFSKVL